MIKGVIAGNFDVLHPGYVDMFKEMRQHCDVLVVLLHEDPTLERPNKLKPVLSVAERVFILKELKIADDVWSLNVGTSVVFFNYTFALEGRSQ